MPFASERQRKFMFAKHPGIAHRWAKEEKREYKKERREHPNLSPQVLRQIVKDHLRRRH